MKICVVELPTVTEYPRRKRPHLLPLRLFHSHRELDAEEDNGSKLKSFYPSWRLLLHRLSPGVQGQNGRAAAPVCCWSCSCWSPLFGGPAPKSLWINVTFNGITLSAPHHPSRVADGFPIILSSRFHALTSCICTYIHYLLILLNHVCYHMFTLMTPLLKTETELSYNELTVNHSHIQICSP